MISRSLLLPGYYSLFYCIVHYTHSMAGPKCDMYPDSPLGTQTDIGNSFRHATKKHSIARIARLPIKVTPLYKSLVLEIGSLLFQALRWTCCVLCRHKFHLTFVVVMLGLFVAGHFVVSYFFRIHSFITRVPLSCGGMNDYISSQMSETEKIDAAAGTTLITLLPALLVFGPFPTAEISAMISYSTWTALITSGFTLGLATSKMVTLGKNRILRVIDLCMPSIIGYYGWTPIGHNYHAITNHVVQ